ncbi:MAG: S41 family peptidase [Lachnospiraceae bacterium]|nr:S41 family peptidase [Lachnospiraceae bacterium]
MEYPNNQNNPNQEQPIRRTDMDRPYYTSYPTGVPGGALQGGRKEPDRSGKKFLIGMLAGFVIALMAFCLVFQAFALVKAFGGKGGSASSGTRADVEKKLTEIERLIDKYYIHDLDKGAEAEGIYAGAVESLGDVYSEYYTADEMKKLMESTEGQFGGIGCYIAYNEEEDYCYIASVIPGFSADRAGIREGDVFYMIDGENVLDWSSEEISKSVRGEEGTTVEVVMLRDGDEMSFTLVREMVSVPTVSQNMLDEAKGVGYIQISEFDTVTKSQFREALEELKDQGMRALCIDLRSNPGGDVDVAMDVASHILPKGVFTYTVDKNGKKEEYKCDGRDELMMPVAVLVNGNTASAAEMLSGAIRDHHKGTLIGTTTYGKGVVQVVVPMKDGSAVKLTTAEYYLPGGECIHGKGIDPDVELELDREAYREDGTDNQKEKALELLLQQLGS